MNFPWYESQLVWSVVGATLGFLFRSFRIGFVERREG